MRDLLYTEHQLAAALSTLESRFLDELQRREVTAATTELQADHDIVLATVAISAEARTDSPAAQGDYEETPLQVTALATAAYDDFDGTAQMVHEDEFAVLTSFGSLRHDDLPDDVGLFNWVSPSG